MYINSVNCHFQPHIRKAALTALNVWVAQSGLLPFVEADIFSDELRKENPFLRAEVRLGL